MAPGRKRDRRKGKEGNGSFSLNAKSAVIKGSSGSNTKKAKDKAVPKGKLKDQTTKWIEDVNKSFNELQPKLAEDHALEKIAGQREPKTCQKKEQRMQSLKSDITDEEVSNTITNMANLLEQT
ncbi:uncharacterized protein LOC116289313 [Actinia tenebrosa]|uniref:Uncharacterized protein LOC116289313 n=1 Tax=Actinia tenebrosa TaxID=6105 RepID=A0A6P8H959_ACTTE|nr:uncharacterized protein LOC116289313 [Actinia tenebrosa]